MRRPSIFSTTVSIWKRIARHPKKKDRPFASGELSIAAGLAVSLGCLTASFTLAALLPPTFLIVLVGYFALTTGYSLYLKSLVLVDVIVLAQLYTLRVYGGGAATDIVPSHWLLTFSLFIFLSLALMKRFTEIRLMSHTDRKDVIGRGYRTTDAEHIASIGSSSGLIAVLVLALYISSKEVLELYSNPEYLWLVCPVMLYWISRAWMLTYRDSWKTIPSYLRCGIGRVILWLFSSESSSQRLSRLRGVNNAGCWC